MKIPDANLLIYAHDVDSPFHEKGLVWLKSSLSGGYEEVAIPEAVVLAFLRIICNPSACVHPLTIDQARQAMESWFDGGAILLRGEPHIFIEATKLREKVHGGTNLMLDCYLAALAIHNRATIYSNDRDFLRFPGLKYKNPVDD
ncbi:MAG TPA: TA system VapC family ribonuclease toxin [Fimbriimonadaceae bacterium]